MDRVKECRRYGIDGEYTWRRCFKHLIDWQRRDVKRGEKQ